MSRRTVFPALLLSFALPALADEPSPKVTTTAPTDPVAVMQADPLRFNENDTLPKKADTSILRLGKSDYSISSPFIQVWRQPRGSGERPRLWKRIAMLPVHLLTPIPQPMPPGGGPYFKWKEASTLPWAAHGPASAPGETINLIKHEPVSTIISVGK